MVCRICRISAAALATVPNVRLRQQMTCGCISSRFKLSTAPPTETLEGFKTIYVLRLAFSPSDTIGAKHVLGDRPLQTKSVAHTTAALFSKQGTFKFPFP
jgi:hypothetical protein